MVPLNKMTPAQLLTLAASVERYSEHPLADAIRTAASQQNLTLLEIADFQNVPGEGVRARVGGAQITIGKLRWITKDGDVAAARRLETEGKTTLFVAREGQLIGVLAAADRLRPETPQAMARLKTLGFKHIEVLTGDNLPTAKAIGDHLRVAYQAERSPTDKINIVKQYQAEGHVVVMVGDGVNDAPALAQADVGIAMGAAGSDIAIQAAHIALLGDHWDLVPQAVEIARRTMRVVKINIAFTAVYNLLGLTLAALGFLPPSSPPPPNLSRTWESWRTRPGC